MNYHRFGHADKLLVKLGDRVIKGQQLGTVGDGNGNYPGAAHVHYDRPRQELSPWWTFVFGLTKDQVRQAYNDSRDLDHVVLPNLHHYGWRYLEYATYGTKRCYHPGSDANGPGAGSADKGQPFFSPCDGVVVHCYAGPDKYHGWGKLLVIKETSKDSEVVDPSVSVPIPVTVDPPVITTSSTVTPDDTSPPVDINVSPTPEVSSDVNLGDHQVDQLPEKSLWQQFLEALAKFFTRNQ